MTKNVQDQIFEFIEPPTEKYQWYILFVASGKEFKIRDKIYRLDNFQNKIRQIWIPSINRFVHIKGKKEVIRETFFNSYVFLLIDLDLDFFRKITEIEDVFCFLWNRGLYSKDIPSPIPAGRRDTSGLRAGLRKGSSRSGRAKARRSFPATFPARRRGALKRKSRGNGTNIGFRGSGRPWHGRGRSPLEAENANNPAPRSYWPGRSRRPPGGCE